MDTKFRCEDLEKHDWQQVIYELTRINQGTSLYHSLLGIHGNMFDPPLIWAIDSTLIFQMSFLSWGNGQDKCRKVCCCQELSTCEHRCTNPFSCECLFGNPSLSPSWSVQHMALHQNVASLKATTVHGSCQSIRAISATSLKQFYLLVINLLQPFVSILFVGSAPKDTCCPSAHGLCLNVSQKC